MRKGKVRDIYDFDQALLFVATDRISAFDCILPNDIPGKGVVLTKLSHFWFKFLEQAKVGPPNHLIQSDILQYSGRFMTGVKANVIPIECVARGYLAGSAWKEYQQSESVCGVQLPSGLKQCDKLPEPIFTPATKEENGHDINISFKQMGDGIGMSAARQLRDHTLAIYQTAYLHAISKGIIIADTKFEYGTYNNQIILIDEVLTPDSSRFWSLANYQPGKDQDSFDKQFVRNWLETQNWDKKPPAPALPDKIIKATLNRYLTAYEMLTGEEFGTTE